jgi:hypothetical protein
MNKINNNYGILLSAGLNLNKYFRHSINAKE